MKSEKSKLTEIIAAEIGGALVRHGLDEKTPTVLAIRSIVTQIGAEIGNGVAKAVVEERDRLVKDYIEVCEHWIGLLRVHQDDKGKELSVTFAPRYDAALEALFPHVAQLRACRDQTVATPCVLPRLREDREGG